MTEEELQRAYDGCRAALVEYFQLRKEARATLEAPASTERELLAANVALRDAPAELAGRLSYWLNIDPSESG